MKSRIVIIDSEKKSRNLLENIVTAGGYEAFGAETAEEGFNLIATNVPEIVILTPLANHKQTLSLIKRLSEWGNHRIIVVSIAVPEKKSIEMLDSGADDYIEKPLTHGEVLARIRVQLRNIEKLNKARGMNPDEKYSANGLNVNFKTREVTVDGKPISLTKNEFMILALLCRYSDRVLTYDFIMESVWGPQISEGTGILRVNVANIRKKLEKGGRRLIQTENGVGYRIIG
ncbi:MAG: response regulator transcription factor [Clostridia bacterium]|nr:response regulator transcription factor [Clostridia bacterium]